MEVTYPFRFYGRTPHEWAEGANDGHGYELTFRATPDAAQRAEIARAFERELAQGAAQPASKPWRWLGSSAAFYVGERLGDARDADAGPRGFCDDVARLCHALHAIAALSQVVFHGAWWEQGASTTSGAGACATLQRSQSLEPQGLAPCSHHAP